MNKKLIIFDMDGTLINSANVITSTINHVRVNLGLDKLQEDLILTSLNDPEINSALFFYGTDNFTKKQTELFTKYYSINCTKKIKLYDGIYDLLEYLKDDFILSVATNASQEFANEMLNALDINKYFSYIIGADMVKHAKPKPDMIDKTLIKLNINAKDAILVGDSKKDVLAAQALNMDSILVNWGFSKHKIAVNDINELKKELLNA